MTNTIAKTAIFALAIYSNSGKTEIAPNIQAVLFSKIFHYCKDIQHKKTIRIAILAKNKDKQALKLLSAFNNIKYQTLLLTEQDLNSDPPELDALYILPLKNYLTARIFANERNVLTISAHPAVMKHRAASIFIKAKPSGRPEIIVDLKNVKQEAQLLSAQLLAMATILR